jgi:hypothetical protein
MLPSSIRPQVSAAVHLVRVLIVALTSLIVEGSRHGGHAQPAVPELPRLQDPSAADDASPGV